MWQETQSVCLRVLRGQGLMALAADAVIMRCRLLAAGNIMWVVTGGAGQFAL